MVIPMYISAPVISGLKAHLTQEAGTAVTNLYFYWETLIAEFKSMIESLDIAVDMLVKLGTYDCKQFETVSEMAIKIMIDVQKMFPFNFHDDGVIASLSNIKTDADVIRYTSDYIRFMMSQMTSLNTHLISATFVEVMRSTDRIECKPRPTGAGLLSDVIGKHLYFKEFSTRALARFNGYKPGKPGMPTMSTLSNRFADAMQPPSVKALPFRPSHMPHDPSVEDNRHYEDTD
jgi:hypothetical protein